MTKERAIIQLRLGPGINEDASEDCYEALCMAIEALEQEPSEDCISRQETLKGYQSVCKGIACHECRAKDADGTCRLESFINNLPTAQPFTTEQIKWERDTAVEQLNELGYGLGEKIIHCKECKYSSPNGKYGCKSYHYRLYETHEMKPDDFCSRAERKEK